MTIEERGTRFYVELKDQADTRAVEEDLRAAGFSSATCRLATTNAGVIILTQALPKGVWNEETDHSHCRGRCTEDGLRHVEYEELTPAQQDLFARDLASYMNENRKEGYLPDVGSLSGIDEMEGIALSHCL